MRFKMILQPIDSYTSFSVKLHILALEIEPYDFLKAVTHSVIFQLNSIVIP